MNQLEPTLEEQYSIDVKSIMAKHPIGSQERAEAKKALWQQHEAGLLLRDGKPAVIIRLQRKLAWALHYLILEYYKGEINLKDYATGRSSAFLRYAAKCEELGIAVKIPDPWVWVDSFTKDALAFERT